MARAARRILVVIATMAAGLTARAQTTDGLIRGVLRDSVSGNPIPGASIACESDATNTHLTAPSGKDGSFGLPLMPPGLYRIRVEETDHQAVNIENLVLPVAGVLDLDLRLRPLADVWERNQYRSVFLPGTRTLAVFYGPDVDTSHSGNFDPPPTSTERLDTSISDVVSPQLIAELPLQGRDVYTALVLEPGVTSDFATSRGIGIAVGGQRPASSNFLLDGAENNNALISGPALALPPETIQEFRFSTGNFSAEYGRTAGFVVNAVTRSGGEHWHGIGYLDANRAGFNANDFQRNAAAESRLPVVQNTFGIQVGGPAPIVKHWLFVDTALDVLRSHGDMDSVTLAFPSASFLSRQAASNPSGYGVRLLERFLPPAGALTPDGMYSIASITPTTAVHRFLGLQRFDIAPPQSRSHLSVRLVGGWLSEPAASWSPYKGFSTALDDRVGGISGNLRTAFTPSLTNEFKLSWMDDNLVYPWSHPEIPDLITLDQVRLPQGGTLVGGVQLPQAGLPYGFQNRSQTTEIGENLTWIRGRQIFKFGVDGLFRSIGGYLGFNGELIFPDLNSFFADSPSQLILAIDRLAFQKQQFQAVNFSRDYHNRQLAFFAQDSVHATSRLSVNFGFRYDNFGVPVNVGLTKDNLLNLGAGADMSSRIAGAKLVPQTGNERLFASRNRDWAGRLGFSYTLDSVSRTVLRGGYGIFYDRPFDNLWENLALNNVQTQVGFFGNGSAFSYSEPITSNLAGASPGGIAGNTVSPVFLYQPGLRTPYVQRAFFGLQRQIINGLVVESDYSGSFGRELITTDRINRQNSVPFSSTNPLGRFNPKLPDIFYRANQGDSSYNALTVKLIGNLRHATFRLAYTWSHSIDNQSEPLKNEYADVSFTNPSAGSSYGVSAFTEQFASSLDRGNSDFDQRHNLVAMGVWDLPRFLRGFHVAGMGAVRSGLPFTAFASEPGSALYNARADLLDPGIAYANQAVVGGVRLLNPAAFQAPANGGLGNTGRNAFAGPGFYSFDVSLARSIHFRRVPEGDRLTFRVDCFNILNHVNLNNPLPVAFRQGFNQNFGVAFYGRTQTDDASPILVPLEETTRQIHLVLRFEF